MRVALGERSYDIQIGSGNLTAFADFLRERTESHHAVLINDTYFD